MSVTRTRFVFRRVFSTMAKLEPYEPPSWASELKNIPTHYVQLAQKNTPIHPWNPPGLPSSFSLAIKRDDMTGSTLSGNKVRKLEFLLADVLNKNCDTVFTCGGIQSNHCRATAVAARQLGLNCYLFLRHNEEDTDIGVHGNLLLNQLVGAKLVLVPYESYNKGLKPRMERMAEKLRCDNVVTPYIIPIGGSNPTGVFGYITAFQELIQQNVLEDYDDIVMCIGSSGTAAGIAIGNYLTGSKLKCHAVSACDDGPYFYRCINKDLDALGLSVRAEEILDIIDGYKGVGYALSTKEELEDIVHISSTTGIMLDPVYTIKSVRGMLNEMINNPSRFKGRRVLYLHTGGVFGLYDGRMDSVMKSVEGKSHITVWKDSAENVPTC